MNKSRTKRLWSKLWSPVILLLVTFNTSMGEITENIEGVLNWDKKEIVLNSEDGVMFAPGSMQLPEQKFTVTNISTSPITIKDVVADCTCLDIKKEAKTILPNETWSFYLDIKIPKYGVRRDIKFIVNTDKGNDQVRLVVETKEFATPSATELVWEINDDTPKRVLFKTEETGINIEDIKVLGDGFKAELLKGMAGVPVLEVVPIKEGFDRGMLRFNIKNEYYGKPTSIRLEKKSE